MRTSLTFILLFFAFLLFPIIVRAQLPVTPSGKFIDLEDAIIYYEEYGQGDPLILLHGFGRTLEDWKPLITEYAKHYRVIAWDMRGHGRSGSSDTTKVFLHQRAAEDLLALVQKLGLGKIKAIGHSSGGILLLEAAIQNPAFFEAIVPVSAQLHFSQQVREFIHANAKPNDYYEFNELEAQHGEVKGRLIARQFYHFSELRGDPSITTEGLQKITARSLIVHGDNDFVPVAEAWEMHGHIPAARLWIVPNGWHIPHLGPGREADFVRITLAFLNNDWDAEDPGN